jgi:pyrimidine operon attenuation protein/uracil phosphoribosyltransferase
LSPAPLIPRPPRTLSLSPGPDTFSWNAPLTRSREARKEKEKVDSSEKVVLGEDDVRRALTRIAHEIAERNPRAASLVIVGIHRRGAFLARRLQALLAELLDADIPLGDLDIGFYRDDVGRRPEAPIVHASHIDFDVTARTVVIVDDVLFTGRTVRAAIEALFDYGRPDRVQLAVLADRGHRELPIRPDYVGKNLPTSRGEHVYVRLTELDGVDEVAIAHVAPTASIEARA